MLKQIVGITGWILVSNMASAQAYEGKVKLEKTEEPALVMEYNFPLTTVNNAFNAKFADMQLNGTPNKDFTLYTNSVIPNISKSPLDYYFKTESVGKSGADKTLVYMVMHGAGKIEGVDQLGIRGKTFLEKMSAEVVRANTIQQIKKQESVLVDEENALAELQNAQKDLEEKINTNRSRQESQLKIIASQKAILDDLKAKVN